MATSSLLEQRLIARIEREGPLPFAEYMRMALYDPESGYYTAGAPRIGWSGDYFTSGDLGYFFAHCLGRQLFQMWEELGHPQPFRVWEQGAGRGELEAGVHDWAEQEQPEFAAALSYRSLDLHHGEDVLSATALQQLSEKDGAPHIILANELVDAFPVHLVEVHQGQLYEIYVGLDKGRLREIAVPSAPEVVTYLDRYCIRWRSFPDGWRAEINLEALRWVELQALLLRQGFLLVIDYGDRASRLYSRARRRGTLLCYHKHRINEQPLARPGEQDITAHVNFSALIDEGRRHGLRLRLFTTQRAWLERMGIFEELEQLRRTHFTAADQERATDQGQIALLRWYNLRQQVLALTDPAGLGNFKVLIMRRRVPSREQH
ncbi:MAG: SAM-dependent methyltransferase [Thermogemmatispora sp.]|uniref:class I SAM-dependent methyltransferase n=1 Tax=Thermogemmatispora sp. TaxID=1968838 RepID=UPI001A07733D|nr:SAM-dependent methyltransferase [Thermogemmatispora sp.]MBE3565661.1 SAM-dependent methyltransferase [Thermogemmatispora sp.]